MRSYSRPERGMHPALDRMKTLLRKAGLFSDAPCIVPFVASNLGF